MIKGNIFLGHKQLEGRFVRHDWLAVSLLRRPHASAQRRQLPSNLTLTWAACLRGDATLLELRLELQLRMGAFLQASG